VIGAAFNPQGNTVAIVSAVTSTAAVQVPNASVGGASQYMFTNVGAVPVFVNYGTSSVAAAVIPVGGTPANGFCIPAGTVPVVLTLIPNAYFRIIATATTSTLYITPGDGI